MKDKISVSRALVDVANAIHFESNSWLDLKLSRAKSCIGLIKKGYIHEDYNEIIEKYGSAEAAPVKEG